MIFAALAGVVVTLGLPPVPWTGVLVPVGLAWFFMQLSRADRPARLAWIFGYSHQLTLLHWLFFLIPAKSIPTRALIPAQALAAIGLRGSVLPGFRMAVRTGAPAAGHGKGLSGAHRCCSWGWSC